MKNEDHHHHIFGIRHEKVVMKKGERSESQYPNPTEHNDN